jgi:hypothetical protein
MYSKSDVLGEDFPMNTEKMNQTGILSIPDIRDGVNPDFLERFSENLK